MNQSIVLRVRATCRPSIASICFRMGMRICLSRVPRFSVYLPAGARAGVAAHEPWIYYMYVLRMVTLYICFHDQSATFRSLLTKPERTADIGDLHIFDRSSRKHSLWRLNVSLIALDLYRCQWGTLSVRRHPGRSHRESNRTPRSPIPGSIGHRSGATSAVSGTVCAPLDTTCGRAGSRGARLDTSGYRAGPHALSMPRAGASGRRRWTRRAPAEGRPAHPFVRLAPACVVRIALIAARGAATQRRARCGASSQQPLEAADEGPWGAAHSNQQLRERIEAT